MKKPRKEHTSERDLIKICFNGLAVSIGAYLRARREQFNMGWSDLANKTGINNILDIERGKVFPTKKTELKKLFNELDIKNGGNLADLIVSMQKFRTVMKERRFKL
jgi:transcriptional regulator with XRE-family HTH domain